ncbi:MAG: hypothetical protein WCS94_14315, partial [Verrucomicrobiota bacterium]
HRYIFDGNALKAADGSQFGVWLGPPGKYLHQSRNPKSKPLVLLHVPVFQSIPTLTAHKFQF